MAKAAVILADGRELELVSPLTIGRSEKSVLMIDDATVSRRHAVLELLDDRWCIEDCGSFNGTFVNGVRMPPRVPQPLRHCDRIRVGAVPMVFAQPEQLADPDTTIELKPEPRTDAAVLSPFQLQVVECLCAGWIEGKPLDAVPSNREIAAALGTPNAEPAVKAALRRVYGKAGLTHLGAHAKRRQLCRLARQRGWI
jgi:hypothetical protein